MDGMTGGAWPCGDTDAFVDITDFLFSKAKNGVIINGILTWIDIQQKETAPALWEAQADEYFSEQEIMEAKKALWTACGKKFEIIGKLVNRSADKKKATIDDIGKAMIKLKEYGVLPLLLGSSDMMKRAPCFNTCPSTANASDVVARVKVLEESLGSYMKLQTEEIKKLNMTVGSLIPPPAAPRPRIESVCKKHKLDEEAEVFVDARDNPNHRKQTNTYANIVGTEPIRNQPAGNMNVNMNGIRNGNLNSNTNGNYNGNTTGQNTNNNQRKRKPSTLLFGKAKTGIDNVENILAANVNLVATGVAKDATANQLKGFIENKGIKVVEIELLTNHPEARTNTFKIAIKPGDYDKAMNPEVLPYRVGVRTFRHKRQQQNSWANQAGQTGGDAGLPAIFIRLLIFIYVNQFANVSWDGSLSSIFSLSNGVRQGAVLSAILYCFYVNDLFKILRRNGTGCWINSSYFGIVGYSDDSFLLAPSLDSLQEMLDICEDYAKAHNLKFSTNANPAKCKTKCLAFLRRERPVPQVKLCGNPLPWVQHGKHLGNTIENKINGMKKDIMVKRATYIDKNVTLNQEFHYTHPRTKHEINGIYNNHFTGSPLWDLFSREAEMLYNSWNKSVRLMSKVPLQTHRYFLEHLSGTRHLKITLIKRFLSFIGQIENSPKILPNILLQTIRRDCRSTTGSNLRNILMMTSKDDILELAPFETTLMLYEPVAPENRWRIPLIKELIDIKWNESTIENLSYSEIEDIIVDICTS